MPWATRYAARPPSRQSTALSAEAVPFEGTHQAGIVTPAQDRLHFAAYDVTTDDRGELIELLKEWTAAARALDGRARDR